MAFQRVCAADDVQVNTPQRFELEGEQIVVVRDSEGAIYAIGDKCSHGDISLSEGFVEGCELECWAHGSKFSLKTGWPQNLPAYEPVPVYEVKLEDGDIHIDPTPTLKEQN
ncbi:non-heme iron oxygenase ferredoxin subunit [Pseudoclavibacter alba]|uniref:Non-heme iron oxygenase ferredoxin subunit n=1 Tax=Pseudoclavibacter albus TaxID=272241 RepID=A0ABT2HUN8_9MICO|nr:non-heme iron oxygenase ferredoxin subunit [Pseudoclavibacter alba]MBN6778007.1 non-heme iron oxygenase ferredoxin subunit [Pseudoclavibacter alba]MCT2042033.1 non-heme iron oxygenase ferredoxin subunit [Pseudoclavibacter alba]